MSDCIRSRVDTQHHMKYIIQHQYSSKHYLLVKFNSCTYYKNRLGTESKAIQL